MSMQRIIDNISFEEYEKLIHTKEELELEYAIFKQHNPEPKDTEKYMEYATENNCLSFCIRNYEILKKNKCCSLINKDKYFEWLKENENE